MPVDIDKLDSFTRAYIECALWSSYSEEVNLNDDYGIDDISLETLEQMALDCSEFREKFKTLLDEAYKFSTSEQYGYYTPSRAGHDFWLTRCGHGAGFWCRGLGNVGNALADAAQAYGNIDLYVGDDGKIYG